ncbi:uncharacterized protein LOC120676166 isoform X2 [Panicum virgatum]|uniref:uncharacterized protein LOC120676166 isoform X2 n=1 Tax=Panicum virgatum TaxID=38727 RepID=UPI0019D5BF3F|nr:uncharacterized protein LOC120676166 isoform X2 [Panicum virgatum]
MLLVRSLDGNYETGILPMPLPILQPGQLKGHGHLVLTQAEELCPTLCICGLLNFGHGHLVLTQAEEFCPTLCICGLLKFGSQQQRLL